MQHCQAFANRFDNNYQDFLVRELAIDRLLETSFPVTYPRERKGKLYKRCCRIDYMGLSATTLLDGACNFIPDDRVPLQFQQLFQKVEALNNEGIFVKMRFLFLYPYTTSFFSLIQAESSSQRAAIDSLKFLRDFRTVEEVDEEMFYGATTVLNQKNSLEFLQELIDNNNWNDTSPNTVRIRFTPVDVRLRMLIINNSLFFDPYLLAKTKRLSKKLSLLAPVTYIDRKENLEAYQHIEDHFRYLWDLDTTLICEDATAYERGKPNTLKNIISPELIYYKNKAERIKELMELQGRKVHTQNEDQKKWMFRLKHILHRYTTEIKPTPSIESVFIACSWSTEADGVSRPNQYARQINEWLEKDFGSRNETPMMSVHILEAAVGKSLAPQVYARLREATLAIIILTGDIKSTDGEKYTKPNVIHELGYLMHHLTAGKLIVLREHDVYVPTNVSHNVYVDFQPQKIDLCYRDIIKWLMENASTIDETFEIKALQVHQKRIDNAVVEGKISQKEGRDARNKIKERIKYLSKKKDKYQLMKKTKINVDEDENS